MGSEGPTRWLRTSEACRWRTCGRRGRASMAVRERIDGGASCDTACRRASSKSALSEISRRMVCTV